VKSVLDEAGSLSLDAWGLAPLSAQPEIDSTQYQKPPPNLLDWTVTRKLTYPTCTAKSHQVRKGKEEQLR
jgi:hypothetical protein